jgi:branched-subunit amino acid transport protein
MSDQAVWLTIGGLALATYLIRLSFLGLLGGRGLPAPVVRALGFVPVTVLPALVAPMVFEAPGGGLGIDPPILGAALGALALGIWLRGTVAGVLGGLAGFLAVTALGL